MGFRFCRGEGAIHRWQRGLGAACLSACHFSCRVVVSGEERRQRRRELERIGVGEVGGEGFYMGCCLGLGFSRLVGSLIIVVMAQ